MYEIAWKVKKLTPTGSAIVNSGNGMPSDSPWRACATDCTKNE